MAHSSPGPPEVRTGGSALRLLLLAAPLLGAAAYWATLDYPYVQDAVPAVKANPLVERGSLVEIFGSDYWAGSDTSARTLYRPLTVWSFALERRVAGRSDPRLSHALNVLFHLMTSLLLARYAARLGFALAGGVAGLLFAVHPLLVQAVANVVGRADVLAALFTLGALLALAASAAPGASPTCQRLGAWLAGCGVWLAMGSKEVGYAAPALLLVQDLLLRRPARWWERAAALAPTLLAVVGHVILRTLAIEAFPGAQPVAPEDNVLLGLAGLPRLATVLAMAGRYLVLLVVPRNLSADYSGNAIEVESSLLAPRVLLGAFGGLLLLGLALAPGLARRARTAGPARAAALASLLVLLPYLVVGNVFVLSGAGFAERLLYTSAGGLCLLSGLAVELLWRRRPPGRGRGPIALALLLLVACGGAWATQRAARMWSSIDALYVQALDSQPRALLARFGLAELRRNQGRTEEALALYREGALQQQPGGDIWWGLGSMLRERGDLSGAEAALRRSIANWPELPRAHFQLGLVLRDTGRVGEAERAFRRTLLLNPRHDRAAEELGHLLWSIGRYDRAAESYRRAVRLGRTDLRDAATQAERLAGLAGQSAAGRTASTK